MSTGVTIGESDGDSDLHGILRLQRANLRGRVDADTARAQGFVTVEHDLATLERMHAMAPSIVAKHQDEVVGYALVMPLGARRDVPVLEPMFALFDRLSFAGRPLTAYRYYVMGQVCVAEAARGQGVFDALYAGHRRILAGRYELCVTEISLSNPRSLRAHARVGFVEIHRYRDATDDWSVVALDLSA
ncbi:MAG: N-acetyltransferase family protein [Myxococcota bacterium]|nr:GNAT family N-acetyltransferase [Myxococcota bacterium]